MASFTSLSNHLDSMDSIGAIQRDDMVGSISMDVL